MLRDADQIFTPPADSQVTQDEFRHAMSLLSAPVAIVTTDGPDGRHGLTVSAICSVSDTPPTLLVCLNRSNRSHTAFLNNGHVGINLLSSGHEDVAAAFARSSLSSEERFLHGTWREGLHGAPLLAEALVTLDCTITAFHASGSHDVLFCRVDAIEHPASEGHALAWFDRRFHALPRQTTTNSQNGPES